ncbi:hypothetical protein GY45DRAFT_1052361 [Cubamyces sp. BRFM 1775]|nr:hypothetical protein GY45DRAFT_1052361 [Cubamyces sp. BRFM 1775]
MQALSFWQYQVHQEHSFQQALYRNVTEKHAQLEKRLENVIREANGEISLLTNKLQDLERDIDTERRKTATLQDSLKESEKEYHKLKAQYDKLKRKALLGGGVVGKDGVMPLGNQSIGVQERQEDPNARLKHGYATGIGGAGGLDVGAVVGNMEAAGIQRTPIVNRTAAGGPIGVQQGTAGTAWRQPQAGTSRHGAAQRQPFNAMDHRSFRTSAGSTARSEHSDSTVEVENLVANTGGGRHGGRNTAPQWSVPQQRMSTAQAAFARGFAPPAVKRSGPKFKPAGVPMG